MNRSHDEFASASADPHIFIDPAFPNASLYSIIVSPGVSNDEEPAAAAPEPAMFPLTGIALAALSLRWRKRKE